MSGGAGPRVVCVGLTTLDVVQRVSEPVVLGGKSRSDAVELVAGGPAANAAVTAAALLPPGAVTLISAVGRGVAADVVRADLTACGVRLVDLVAPGHGGAGGAARGPARGPARGGVAGRDGGAWALPVATCVVHADGERTVVSPGAQSSTWNLSDEARDEIARAAGVLVDGHHPVAGEAALHLARAGRVTTVLDAGSVKAHVEGWLRLVDVAAASSAYGRQLGLDPSDTLDHLLEAGCGTALVTDGPRDVRWRSARGGSDGAVTPPAVTAADSLGAGDAFHGALVAALAQGQALPGAVGPACRVAAVRVSHASSRGWLADIPTALGPRP